MSPRKVVVLAGVAGALLLGLAVALLPQAVSILGAMRSHRESSGCRRPSRSAVF